jgi:hypothetical protein
VWALAEKVAATSKQKRMRNKDDLDALISSSLAGTSMNQIIQYFEMLQNELPINGLKFQLGNSYIWSCFC